MELKKGKYLVVDPCYIYPDDDWSDFGDIYFKTGDGEIETKYGNFFVCGTAYGDGSYQLKRGGAVIGTMGVDAGLLSVIPLEILKKWGCTDSRLGCLIDVEDCEISYNGGDFEFGGFSVNTSGSDDLEDSEDEDEDNAGFDEDED